MVAIVAMDFFGLASVPVVEPALDVDRRTPRGMLPSQIPANAFVIWPADWSRTIAANAEQPDT